VYENWSPAWVTYDEGRVVLNSDGTWNVNEAYLKDHLGNVRVVYYYQYGTLKAQQVNSYYPFGMNIKGLTANGSATYKTNEYLYNGKMMQDEMGLGWLDYGARFYDPVLARWHSVDPLSEKDRKWSPYRYGYDNPLRYVDPDGMSEDWVESPDKSIHWQANVTSANDPDLNKGDKYIGKTANIVDDKGNVKYGAQDGKVYNATALNGPTVTTQDPYAGTRHLYQDDKGYGPATSPMPDYVSLTVSGTAIVGGGGGVDLNIVYVKGDGVDVTTGFRAGSGLDISGSVSVTTGSYSGEGVPTIKSTSGGNSYQNINFGPISVSTQQDLSTKGVGQNWTYVSAGLGVGIKSLPIITGSAGVAVTSKPLFKK
jgi:RHS repeat-associated protein